MEIRIWAKLDHEFVLPLLGFVVEGENLMPALVSVWMERGTLHDVMKTFPRGGIETCAMARCHFTSLPLAILTRLISFATLLQDSLTSTPWKSSMRI